MKLVLPRDEAWLTLNRHPATITVALGARSDGTLVAKRVTCHADTGAYADSGPGVAQKMGYAAPGPYRIPNVAVDALCVYTNLPPNGAFRGYGQMQSAWASERAMDMLAERLGLDPLELRLRNVLREGDVYCTGETMHDVHFAECLQAAADAIDWSSDRRGKGLSLILKGMQTPSRASVAIEAETATRWSSAARRRRWDRGRGGRSRCWRRRSSDVDAGRIRFPDPDTSVVPYDTRTTSSRSTYMMGRAIAEAVRDLRAGDGKRGFAEVSDEGGLDPDTGQGIASVHWHQGAAAAEVRGRRGDGEGRGRAPARVDLRRARRQPGRGGAPERGLDDHGPRQRALRGHRLQPRATSSTRTCPTTRCRVRRLAREPHPRPDRAGGRRRPRSRRDGAAAGTGCGRQRDRVARHPAHRSADEPRRACSTRSTASPERSV